MDLERLFSKMLVYSPEDGGGGGGSSDGGDGEDPNENGGEKKVPYDRFKEVNEAKNQALAEVEKLKKTVGQLQNTIKKSEDDKKSEVEKLQDEIKQLSESFETEKQKRLRLKIASETGLPPALVDRLRGETEDELKADALNLVELIPEEKRSQSKGTPPIPGGGDDDDKIDLESMSPGQIRDAMDKGKLKLS